MIFADSRYASGNAYKSNDARNNTYQKTVIRKFPTKTFRFYTYVWKEGDRIDLVANEFFGDPSYWWRIMDINPEIINAFDIPIGTNIRIPNNV